MNQITPSQLDLYVADAVLGIDTLWGGDVMNPSGTGRFIADSWFSDEPLPAAYTHPAAALLRQSGGVGAKEIDRDAFASYLRDVDLPAAIAGLRKEAARCAELRRAYLEGLAVSLDVMWDLAMEVLGKGDPVPYTRAVEASTARPPEPSRPEAKRERVAELLGRAGHSTSQSGGILAAVDAWRANASRPWPRCKRWARPSSRTSTRSVRKISSRTCLRNLPPCLAPTSISCPSRTHGSRGR